MSSMADRTGKVSKRRHQRNHEQGSTKSCVTALAAITIAATCFVSSTSAFTSPPSTSSGTRNLDNRILVETPTAPYTVDVCGFRSKNSGAVSSTRLFARSSDSEKEEWKAILAAFQMYKAAYGDLKIPTRFVVPAMAPWPGKLCFPCSLFHVSVSTYDSP